MSAVALPVEREPVRASRSAGLDAFRGLAMLVMLADHLLLVSSGPLILRETLGRLAMPMFFCLAGHLARRLRWRHLGVALLGVFLPLVVPWIDAPNVLLVWALGCGVLWLGRRYAWWPWALSVLGLTVAANGWAHLYGTGYDVPALLGLMGLGAVMPRRGFEWAAVCPPWVSALGRRPVTFYVGHLVALDVVLSVLLGRVV